MTDHERWLQAVMNNVVYYLNEPPNAENNESDYCLPCTQDKVNHLFQLVIVTLTWSSLQIYLCWSKESLEGFCTVKCKGTPVPQSCMDTYPLDIVDSVFVRKDARGKGYGSQLVSFLSTTFISQLGFSNPLSTGMRRLLLKYLSNHSEDRDRFWLCDGVGDSGDKLNIWMNH